MLGHKLRSYRKKQGISLADLSRQTEISKSYLSYIERNVKQNPSIEVLKKIAAVMDISVEELIGDTWTELYHEEEEELLDEEWVLLIEKAIQEGVSKEQFKHFQEYIKYLKWAEQNKKNGGTLHEQ
ncbi:helix-turn-helix domain-containing protein [Salibacterium halotolerans]|uniref:XRE family transcriptional regulator, master regulator for biofilm formation n=1 Tax=Salibacterium halotolerans TaxID=1884432 RepID=A0A1I5RMI6_9BACI|nr:helix-turn-helix transcriptional regulator [Salibacterium halotolerans]SFP59116.1 XRE family transcriptional regulator, master regulator for biofilm formation [Salibacterium halotolerans]